MGYSQDLKASELPTLDLGMDSQMASAPKITKDHETTSLYVQIATQFIKATKEGELPLGKRPPTKIALSGKFRASQPSVREELSSLQYAGYVESKKGLGTIVCSTIARGAEKYGHLIGETEKYRRFVRNPSCSRTANSSPSCIKPEPICLDQHEKISFWDETITRPY